MSNTPWDSGGMNKHDNYDGNMNEGQSNTFYNQADYRDMNSSYNPGWSQNNWFPQDYLSSEHSSDHVNHISMSNDLSGINFSQTSSTGCNAYTYGSNNFNDQHWTGQLGGYSYPQHQPNNDSHYDPHGQASQQLTGFEANNFYSSDVSGHQEFLNKPKEYAEYENIPLTDGMQPSNENSKEVQALETELHVSDQQILSQVVEAKVDSSNADQFQQLIPGMGLPPVGTMTGIPTRNQFRKGPSKKYYLDPLNESTSNYPVVPSSYQAGASLYPDQKLNSPGSGDRIDTVADPAEEYLEQKFVDNEVALLSQNNPSLAGNIDSPGHSVLPAKQSEEVPVQGEINSINESEAKSEKDELKSCTEDNKHHQAHSSDSFNAFQHFSRKKPFRDSTVSPALWENFDISPLKLGPKLVPTQEVETVSSLSDDGIKSTSPIQNTGTGPSNNNLTSNSDFNSVGVLVSDKPMTTPIVPASFPLDLTSFPPFSDGTSVNPKSAFQPVQARAEETATSRDSLVSDQSQMSRVDFKQAGGQSTPQMQQLEQQMHHLTTSESGRESAKQSLLSHQMLNPQQVSIDANTSREHQPPHQSIGGLRQLSNEGDQQAQQVPLVTTQISDPHLSAFSTVKPSSSMNSLPNIQGSTIESGNESVPQGSSFSNVSRKVAYSALNPEPTSYVKPERVNNLNQNVQSLDVREQDNNRVLNDDQRLQKDWRQLDSANPNYNKIDQHRPISRHESDSHYYADVGRSRDPNYNSDQHRPISRHESDSQRYADGERSRNPNYNDGQQRPLSRHENDPQYYAEMRLSRDPNYNNDQRRPISRHESDSHYYAEVGHSRNPNYSSDQHRPISRHESESQHYTDVERSRNPNYNNDQHRPLSRHENDPQYQGEVGPLTSSHNHRRHPGREYHENYHQKHQGFDSMPEYDQRFDGPPSDTQDHRRDRSSRREYCDDQLRSQKPDSKQYQEGPLRHDDRSHGRPTSRHEYERDQRQNFYRPPSRANEFPEDRRHAYPRDLDGYGRPLSRQSDYEGLDRSERWNRPPEKSTKEADQGYGERRQHAYPEEGHRSRIREERSRNLGERAYVENRLKYKNDRFTHPDDGQKYYGPPGYADRELSDPYGRPRSGQGYPLERYYQSRNDPMLEAFNRPRSRQDDQHQAYWDQMDWMRQYGSPWAYYYMSPEQRPYMDSRYMEYMNYYYNKGYYQEMATYVPPEFNQSVSGMDPVGIPSRSSSRNFNNITAADQFARESEEGSRPTSEMSGLVISTRYMEEKRRLTPLHFPKPHVRATFTHSGQLLQVMPNNPVEDQPAIVRILSLGDEESDEVKEMKRCPGPLVRGVHKKDVQDFCKSMSLRSREDLSLVDRQSVQLIWDFLSLLIKQNGALIGTDISELLIQGKDVNIMDVSQDNDNDGDNDLNAKSSTGFDRSIVTYEKHSLHVTNRFRELLLFGRKKDALDWAAEQHLWGHALCLASQMDAKTFASVKTKFTNMAMKDNDPLQTLYQLMSGRLPPSVSLLDDKWRDWRPHLSMVISNPTNKPELDKKSIVTLGDTLASRGLLHASHFCYLVGQTIFGSIINSKNPKLLLIGSPQGLPLNKYANSAIWATEVYEYALSLADPNFNLTSLVTYKYIYMIRLLDLGLFEEALKYAEVLAQSIIKNPVAYSPAIIKVVADLSTNLRMWDPQRDFDVCDGEMEPTWCSDIKNIARMVNEGTICFQEGMSSPQVTSTRDGSEVGEILTSDHQQQVPVMTMASQWTNQSYQQDQSSMNQSLGWSNPNHVTNTQLWHNQQHVEGFNQSVQHQPEFSFNAQGQFNPYIPSQGGSLAASTSYHQETTSVQQQHPEFTIGTSEMQRIPAELGHKMSYNQHHHPLSQKSSQDIGHGSRSRTVSSSSNASRRSSGGMKAHDDYKFGTFPDVSNTSLKAGMDQPLGVHNPEEKPKKRQPFPLEDPDDLVISAVKKNNSDKKKSGWFSFFGKNKVKDVSLPDDSKPKLVWDSTKKVWVDTEEGEQSSADQELAPPPALHNPANQAGVNMFARGAKPRGARAQYADVLGNIEKPNSAIASSLLSSALPKSASMPTYTFNPASLLEGNKAPNQSDVKQAALESPTVSQAPQDNVSSSQQQAANMPQFFDPSEIRSVPQPAHRQPPWMGQRGHYAR